MEKKQIVIGYEDFRELIEKGYYYVDKSHMIKELLDRTDKVNLFTRPRRFGKTLNLSMLRRFFEFEMDEDGEKIDNRNLFEGLKISSCGQTYLSHQQQYPVINLSLKSAKQPNYSLAYTMLKREIAAEYDRHRYVLSCQKLTEKEKDQYQGIMGLGEDPALYIDSLKFLSACLSKYHSENVIILIDEYDVPLENAWASGFYEEMITFIRSLFESALKTNPHLEFAVITGCLRISRESIFTGLNNLAIHSILSPGYTDAFGFTENEVKRILTYYELEDKYPEVQSWYDGYRFGQQEIYNPWSIINYVQAATIDHESFPKAYWSNTSSNSIIRELVDDADLETKAEIESLISGNTIEKPVHEDITYGEIHKSKDNLWNFLYFTGYLKKIDERKDGRKIYLTLAIPNEEIISIYEDTILAWFDEKVQQTDLSTFFTAIESGDCKTFGRILSGLLLETISFYDYTENYYHGFLAGLLKTSKEYRVYSNRESGTGRPDLIMKTPTVRDGTAVIFELKVTDEYHKMDELCHAALKQIADRDYAAALRAEGYQEIKKYGICFYRKECLVVKE